MSATLNGGSFRSDDTLYGASRTLKSYLRSILMHKHGIRLIPKSALGSKAEKLDLSIRCPLYPRKRTSTDATGSELARLFFTFAGWSVQPCVRPVRAAHKAAGHNALRGSGPGQKPAFDNALAHVGYPDRRIDRLCFTCCSPSQPSHHARVRGAISLDLQRRRIIVPRARSHHCPSHSRKLVGKRDRRNFGRPSRQ